MAVTEVKVPALLVPGAGNAVLLTTGIWDKVQNKSQQNINTDIARIPSILQTLESLVISGKGTEASTIVITTPIVGLTSANVQAALEEIMALKADKTNTVFYEDTAETVPSVNKILVDEALIAYSDSKGNDLSEMYDDIQLNTKSIVDLTSRVEENKSNYLPLFIEDDKVILAGGNEIVRFTKEYVSFKDARVNNKQVITEHQDISGKADNLKDNKPVLYQGDVYEKDQVYNKQEITNMELLSKNDLGDDLNKLVYGLNLLNCSTPEESPDKIIAAGGTTKLKIGLSYKVKMEFGNTADDVTVMLIDVLGLPLYFSGERASSSNTWNAGDVLEIWSDGEKAYSRLW